MTTTPAQNGLLKETYGKPTMLITGGGKWSQKEIEAMIPRQVTQEEYSLRAKQIIEIEIARIALIAKNKTLKDNYRNNTKTFRAYNSETKSYAPINKG